MKKFMLVLTVAAVLFGAFALTGCNGKNATESYRNVYLVSAIAGANYLQQSADASDFYAGVSADGSYFASARVGASGLYVADTENASGETAGRPEEASVGGSSVVDCCTDGEESPCMIMTGEPVSVFVVSPAAESTAVSAAVSAASPSISAVESVFSKSIVITSHPENGPR